MDTANLKSRHRHEWDPLLNQGPRTLPAELGKRRRVRREVTIGDAAEKIFAEVGDLHINNLYSRLLKIKGIEDITKQSPDGALRKDKKGRFDLRG